MGLDMYAYRIRNEFVTDMSEVDVQLFNDQTNKVTLPEPIHSDGNFRIYDLKEMATVLEKQSATAALTQPNPEPEKFFYWRKHPNLHGWMEQKYIEKGGADPMFNCSMLHLSREDLEQLHSMVSLNFLPYTEGFFFGESDGSEKEQDLEFIKQALSSIDEGYRVYYRAWY